METEVTNVTPVEETPIQETPEEKPKRTRRKPEKTRELETLFNASIKTMTDKEKNVLIDALRGEVNKLKGANMSYQNNAELAIRRAQNAEEINKKLEVRVKQLVGFMLQTVDNAQTTTHLLAEKLINENNI